MLAEQGAEKTLCWVGPGFSPDIDRLSFDGLQALRYGFP
jgi:hypothetical protein